MQIMRYAEEGSIRFLWIIGTNPAVSLPELHRIRSILSQDRLFVVVSDAFLTETAALADVVFPAALWGEKTGTFTNHDRTVHLSEQAVRPPGEARPDMEIFLDYADGLGLQDKDGEPLDHVAHPGGVLRRLQGGDARAAVRLLGLTYEKLRGGSGIQWPCNDEHPEGTARLYTDHLFNTDTDDCEDFGHDLSTGASFERKDHADLGANGTRDPEGRAHRPPHEPLSRGLPVPVHHRPHGVPLPHPHQDRARTRAPGGGAVALGGDLAGATRSRSGIAEGDLVRVESARGQLRRRPA